MESSKLVGLGKGYRLSIKGIRKGWKNGVWNAKGLNFKAELPRIKVPPAPRWTFLSRNWKCNVHINNSVNIIPHIDLRSILRNQFGLKSLLQDLPTPWKNIHFSKFGRRRSSFHSHFKSCFLWLLELKCCSSKKQAWVGAPTSSLASRFPRRRYWGCVSVGLLEEPKERMCLMPPRLLRPWVLTGHSYEACCNHVNSSQPLSL